MICGAGAAFVYPKGVDTWSCHMPLVFVFIDSFYVLLEMAFVYLPYDCSTLVYAYAHQSQSLCVYSRCSIWPDGQTEPHTAHIITIII